MVLGLLSSGCDRFLTSSKPQTEQEETIVIETSKDMACVEGMPEKLNRFFNDESQSDDLPSSVACIQSSLRSFMKYTRGDSPNFYTGKELQHFFNRYLLKKNQINTGFQEEMMKMKVVLVGGNADQVTRAEIEKLISLLSELGNELQSLRGQIRLLFFKRDIEQTNLKQIEDLQKSTQEFVAFLIDRTKISTSRYELLDLIKFMREIENFSGPQEAINVIFKWLPLVTKVKALFLDNGTQGASVSDWKNSFAWSVDTYFSILKWHYKIRFLSDEKPSDWNVLMNWTDDIFDLIVKSPQMQENKLLEAKHIDDLIEEVYKLELFKTALDKELAKRTYRNAIAFILERGNFRGSSFDVSGISERNLKVLLLEYRIWRLSQQFLVDSFGKAARMGIQLNTRNLRFEAKNYNYLKVIDQMNPDPQEREELIQSWKDFYNLIFAKNSIVTDLKGKMRMEKKLDTLPNTLAGGNLLNSNRSYVRLIMRGYADLKEKNLFENFIPQPQFLNLEEDFREFAQKMGFVDPRNSSPAARTFMEANFLTYDGNGDELMSSTEGIQLLSQMMSGGRAMVDEIFKDIRQADVNLKKVRKSGCIISEKDIFGKDVTVEPCFINIFRKNSSRYFESMPGTASYLSKMSEKEFEEYYQLMMVVAGLEKRRPGYIEYSEIRSMMVIMHYLESLLVVYDLNNDQLLDEKELLNAMPRFKDFIVKMSPLGDWFVSDIFLYLVYKGEKPTARALPGFKWERTRGLGTVNRLNLIRVLSLLKSQSKVDAASAGARTR